MQPCASTIVFCALLVAMSDTLVLLLSKVANLVVLAAPVMV